MFGAHCPKFAWVIIQCYLGIYWPWLVSVSANKSKSEINQSKFAESWSHSNVRHICPLQVCCIWYDFEWEAKHTTPKPLQSDFDTVPEVKVPLQRRSEKPVLLHTMPKSAAETENIRNVHLLLPWCIQWFFPPTNMSLQDTEQADWTTDCSRAPGDRYSWRCTFLKILELIFLPCCRNWHRLQERSLFTFFLQGLF